MTSAEHSRRVRELQAPVERALDRWREYPNSQLLKRIYCRKWQDANVKLTKLFADYCRSQRR